MNCRSIAELRALKKKSDLWQLKVISYCTQLTEATPPRKAKYTLVICEMTIKDIAAIQIKDGRRQGEKKKETNVTTAEEESPYF